MQKSENRIRQQDKDRRICHRFPICSQKAMIKNKEIQSIQLEIQDFTASEIHEHFHSVAVDPGPNQIFTACYCSG
jgi:hypothetical protein